MIAGEKFKLLRKRKGLTLQEVAEALGLKSTGHLSQIERGEKEPSPSLINNFLSTFSVSENWWATGKGEMFASQEIQHLRGAMPINEIPVLGRISAGFPNCALAKGAGKRSLRSGPFLVL